MPIEPEQPLPLANVPGALQRRIKNGLLIFCEQSPASLSALSSVIEQNLKKQSALDNDGENPRLKPNRYNLIGDWPPRPEINTLLLASCATIWVLLTLASIWLFPRNIAAAAIAVATTGILFAIPPAEEKTSVSAVTIRTTPTAEYELVQAEHQEIVTPFSGSRASCGHTDFPMLPLAATPGEIAQTTVEITQTEKGLWQVTTVNKNDPQRVLPVIFTRRFLISNQPLEKTTLSPAVRISREGWTYFSEITLGGTLAKPQILTAAEGKNTTPGHFLKMFLDENLPGAKGSFVAGIRGVHENLTTIIGFTETAK